MSISTEVNLFCLSIILIFVILLFLKYFQNIFCDSTSFWSRFSKNSANKQDDDFLITVVYSCDGSIRTIIEQIKNIQILYEQNFQNDKKLEIIVLSDVRHENYTDIKLLNKVFPNLLLMTTDLSANGKLSSKNFIAAACAARGKFIVEAKTFADEIDKLQQTPSNYISIFNNENRFYFSVISKSSLEYIRQIHFINTIPVEEFMLISKKMNIPFDVLKKNKTKNDTIFTQFYTSSLVKLADFCYIHNIWKLPQESNKGDKLKKS